jgi:hypothetical protein
MRTQRLKIPVLVPLFASILVLLATFTFAIYRLQQQHITNDVQTQLENTKRAFNQFLTADAHLLSIANNFIKSDPDIQAAWLAKDRASLLKYAAPTFDKIHSDYRVTHFYFIDVNGVCFLRVHKPESFGDHINRSTFASAASTQKQAWGIELGPFGTFTLRVVQPWFVNNSLAGYIELGEEIDHITPQLKDALNIDLVVFIYKSLLNRSDCVIADSTMSFIPPEYVKFAARFHKEHKDQIYASTLNGSTYRAGFLPLLDASAKDVGDILVIRNVSAEHASLQALLAVVATLCFLVASLLVSFFYIHIAGIEKRFLDAH